jgi:glycerol uptake facilitator-like aquaporin
LPAPAAKASFSFFAKLVSVAACSISMVARRSTPNSTKASWVISIVVCVISLTAAAMMAEALNPAPALWRDHGRS